MGSTRQMSGANQPHGAQHPTLLNFKTNNYGNNPLTNLHNSNAHLGSNITT
jgi:hypothetical protein